MATRAFALVKQGSRPLASLLWTLVWRKDAFVTGITLFVGVALARYFLLITPAHPWLLAIPPALWCLTAAGLAMQDHDEDDDQDRDEEPDEDDEEEPDHGPEEGVEEEPQAALEHAPDEVYDAVLEWTRQMIGDRNGVHLSALLSNAHQHGLLQDFNLTRFRGALEEWGIPVRQQLKIGARNRPGIHRADLP